MSRVTAGVGSIVVRQAVALADAAAGREVEAGRGPLTEGQARRIAALRGVARLLDSAVRVPGTSRTVGLDPLIGLLAGYGDLVSPLFTLALLWQARDMGLPRMVQVRMLYNAGLDALAGMVPVAGDLFDLGWKANQRNVALLERYARNRRPTFADRAFALLLMAALVGIAVVPILVVAALAAVLAGAL